eukprot:superscaffoldBa00012063_g25504
MHPEGMPWLWSIHRWTENVSYVATTFTTFLMFIEARSAGRAQFALKFYAHHNPDEDIAAIHREALLLDAEHGNSQPEVTCASVNNSHVPIKPLQETKWKETLKRDIMEDVKSQMKGLTQEVMKEIKPLLQPNHSPQHSLGGSDGDHPPMLMIEMNK